MSGSNLFFAALASILANIVASLAQQWLESLRWFGKLTLIKRLILTLIVFVPIYWLSVKNDIPEIVTMNLADRQKFLGETQTALANEQMQIQYLLTSTAQAGEVKNINISVESTGTAIAQQINSFPATQTTIAKLSRISIVAKVDPKLPVNSLNVRSSPEIISEGISNIVGWLKPGDVVIITAWTNSSWTWCRIDVPGNDKLRDVWVSNYVNVNKKTYQTLILDGLDDLPPALYIEYSTFAH